MDDDDARDALRRAVARLPDNPALRLHLAEQLLAAGHADEAHAHALVVQGLGHAPERVAALLARVTAAAEPEAEPELEPEPEPGAIDDDALAAFLTDAATDEEVDRDRRQVRFDDVAGLDEVVREIRSAFLVPMRDPELRRAYGLTAGGGLLLYGPPGCGKTLVARALAGEADARFVSLSLADVVTDARDSALEVVRRTFEAARALAPTVLFLDEVDAVGARRTNVGPGHREIVTQILEEMDGLEVRTESVLFLGATNQPWLVDPALRRPGRFDRTLLVLPPDRAAREVILERNLRGRPVERIDLADLARRTDGFTGADLRLLCETAARHVALTASAGERPPITGRDLRAALDQVGPSIGPWLEIARNFATFANGSGDYADLVAYLGHRPSRRRR